MSPTNQFPSDKSRVVRVLEILPERFVDEFANIFLLEFGKITADHNERLDEYYNYSTELMSEFSDNSLNSSWKNLNESFYALNNFIGANFHALETISWSEYAPYPYLYLHPHLHPELRKSKVNETDWHSSKHALDAIVKDFLDKYQVFIKTAKSCLSEKNDRTNTSKKVSLKGKKITFDEDKSSIIIDGTPACDLPPYKNEFALAKYMFGQSIKSQIAWDLIAEEMDGYSSGSDRTKDERAKKRMRDTFNRLNNRVKKAIHTDDNLLTWKDHCIRRNF